MFDSVFSCTRVDSDHTVLDYKNRADANQKLGEFLKDMTGYFF